MIAPLAIQKLDSLAARTLSSGRTVLLRIDGTGEHIEVRSPEGDVEMSIALTDRGPVVTLRGARLEIESPGHVGISCGSLEVQSRQTIALRSDEAVRIDADEIRAKTDGDIHLNGAVIRLNCTPEPLGP
jgi:hypothetical protein